MRPHISPRSLNCEQIVFNLINHCDDLRDLPEAITRAAQLARDMTIELIANCDEGRPHYVNQRSLDAVLAMIQGTAKHLARLAADLVEEDNADLVEEDDADLPRVAP